MFGTSINQKTTVMKEKRHSQHYGQHNAHADWARIMSGTSINLKDSSVVDYLKSSAIEREHRNALRSQLMSRWDKRPSKQYMRILRKYGHISTWEFEIMLKKLSIQSLEVARSLCNNYNHYRMISFVIRESRS